MRAVGSITTIVLFLLIIPVTPIHHNFFIENQYKSQDVTFFDDTPYTDQFQSDIYQRAYEIFIDNNLTSVVDIGCGSAYKLMKWFAGFKTIGFDLEPTLSFLKSKYPENENRIWYESKLDIVPPIKKVDMIICSDMIEHIADPNVLLIWLKRIQFKYLIISTPDREGVSLYYKHGQQVEKSKQSLTGPPVNIYHVREWNFDEFFMYISHYFSVVEHKVSEKEFYCQYIVATPFSETSFNVQVDFASDLFDNILWVSSFIQRMDYEPQRLVFQFHVAMRNSSYVSETTYCKYYQFSLEQCNKVFSKQVHLQLESKQYIKLNVSMLKSGFSKAADTTGTIIWSSSLTWYYHKENVGEKVDEFCSNFASFLMLDNLPTAEFDCYERLEEKLLDGYLSIMNDYELNNQKNMQTCDIWEARGITVVSPKPYTVPYFEFIANNQNFIFLQSVVGQSAESLDDMCNKGVSCIRSDYHSSNCSTRSLSGPSPSLCIVITTTTKPQLFGMLASLQSLESTDHLVIVFDGFDSSTMDNSHIEYIKSLQSDIVDYAKSILKCQILVYYESISLGFWGHAARNKFNTYYDNISPLNYDFVIHADDDDVFLPGAIEKIKQTCQNKGTLYVFRMTFKHKKIIWENADIFSFGNIGTPNGVIPRIANQYGVFGLNYGGDLDFYHSLLPYVHSVEFIDFVTYLYIKDI